MTNKPFKAKLTITQDDLDAKFQELANKKESFEEWIEFKKKQRSEWKEYEDELNTYDYDGIHGIPDVDHPFLNNIFSEIRRELFYNVKDLLNDPLFPKEIKFLIDSHEQLQALFKNSPLEHYGIPSKVKDENEAKDFIRIFRFLYSLWRYVQKGPSSIKDTRGHIAAVTVNAEIVKEIMEFGRAKGSASNREKAAVRKNGLRKAAIHRFKEKPRSTYDECVSWIKSNPSLKLFITYGKGKIYSDRNIKELIKGTKEEALKAL